MTTDRKWDIATQAGKLRREVTISIGSHLQTRLDECVMTEIKKTAKLQMKRPNLILAEKFLEVMVTVGAEAQ